MNTKAQDKLWNELSEEDKKKIQEDWQMLQRAKAINDLSLYGVGRQDLLVELFGYHNLNPEPQIKTWEDVENYLEIIPDFKEIIHNLDVGCCNQKVTKKIIATYKISRIIELGYGGMVSEEEWSNAEFRKYGILMRGYSKELFIKDVWQEKCFIAFHTKEQAKEFMSHESNRKLVEQYYMM